MQTTGDDDRGATDDAAATGGEMKIFPKELLLRAACGVTLIGAAPAWATALSTADKTTLATETMNSCLAHQAKQTANANLTVGKLQSYCDCYGKAMAEKMTAEDLEKNQEALTPEMTKVANTAMQSCAATTLKK